MLAKVLIPWLVETWPVLLVFGCLLGGLYIKHRKDVYWATAPVLAVGNVKEGDGWKKYEIVEFIDRNHIRLRNGEIVELPTERRK